MTQRTVKHEVKFQKSVIIILGVLAFGVCANVFVPTFSIDQSHANERDYNRGYEDGYADGTNDC